MEKTSRPPRLLPLAAGGAVLDFLLVRELFRYLNFPAYWFAPLLLGLGFAMYRAAAVRSPRVFVGSAVFSLLLAASVVAGGKVNVKLKLLEPVYRSDLRYLAAFALTFFFVFSALAGLMLRRPIPLTKTEKMKPGTVWALSAAILFACWIPSLLVFMPGNISWDSVACVDRAIGRAGLSNQQPVFYILLMKPFFQAAQALGRSRNFGAAAFLAFQAAAMAAMLGYLPCWLRRKGYPVWAGALALVYFALDPVFPMYAVTMWKDVLFGGLMLLYMLNVFDAVQSGGEWLKRPRNFVWFLSLNLLLSFLRNNGYYIAVVTLTVLAVLFRKEWKRLVPAFLAIAAAVPIVQGPVYRACGVSPSPFAESVGIPLQQIAYTVTKNGVLTQEQADFLNRLLPLDEMKDAYQPFTANSIKFHEDFDNEYLEKNKLNFLRVWAQMAGPNRKDYLKAYCMATVGYWHVGTTNWVLFYGVQKNYGAEKSGLTPNDSYPVNSAAAKRQASIEKDFTGLQQYSPVLSLLVNIGFLFWAVVFSAVMMILRRKGKHLVALLPLFLLWGTLMIATPVYCEFRYMFAFAAAFSAAVLLAFPAKGEETA